MGRWRTSIHKRFCFGRQTRLQGKGLFTSRMLYRAPRCSKRQKDSTSLEWTWGQLVREIPGESDKCEIYWLMDCEYNGWIMSSILTIAMPVAQLDFIECVRELAKTL